MKTYRIKIQEALDWQFPTDREATTLRQALVDTAEDELQAWKDEKPIGMEIIGDEFVMSLQ